MDNSIMPYFDLAIKVTSEYMLFDTSTAITSLSRTEDMKNARHIIRYMLYRVGYKQYSAYWASLNIVASLTGCTNHTTVMSSLDRAEELITKNRIVRKMVDDFEMSLIDIITKSEAEIKAEEYNVVNELKNLYLCIASLGSASEIKEKIKNRIEKYEQQQK